MIDANNLVRIRQVLRARNDERLPLLPTDLKRPLAGSHRTIEIHNWIAAFVERHIRYDGLCAGIAQNNLRLPCRRNRRLIGISRCFDFHGNALRRADLFDDRLLRGRLLLNPFFAHLFLFGGRLFLVQTHAPDKILTGLGKGRRRLSQRNPKYAKTRQTNFGIPSHFNTCSAIEENPFLRPWDHW